MSRIVLFDLEADRELFQIAEWYERANPGLGSRFSCGRKHSGVSCRGFARFVLNLPERFFTLRATNVS